MTTATPKQIASTHVAAATAHAKAAGAHAAHVKKSLAAAAKARTVGNGVAATTLTQQAETSAQLSNMHAQKARGHSMAAARVANSVTGQQQRVSGSMTMLAHDGGQRVGLTAAVQGHYAALRRNLGM